MTVSSPRRLARLDRGDDTGSMAFFLILAVVGLAIAALLTPLVISSSRATRSDTSRAHALDAAQAGVNAMLAKIRSSQTDGVGTSTLLPCKPLYGQVSSTAPAAYTVNVDYYVLDPKTLSLGDLQSKKMTCAENYGTFGTDSGVDTFTPKYARITATGTDGSAANGSTAGRTLATTYVFKTTNSNIVGGRIRIYPASGSSPEMCLDAGLASPMAGALIKLQPCTSPPSDQQTFAYRTDLTIQLLSSITSVYPNGLCLVLTTDSKASLRECAAEGSSDLPVQQWSFNDYGGFTASTGKCLSTPSQAPGTQVTVATCDTRNNLAVTSPSQAWIPSPAVGAGAASPPQLVNFAEFGRCIDVPATDPGRGYLWLFPCKQNPNRNDLRWNQKFPTPGIASGETKATGLITTVNTDRGGSQQYCLTSPGTNGADVRLATCASTEPLQTWTVFNGDSSLPYSTKYTIVDSGGRCLGLKPARSGDNWSSIDVNACTGGPKQKWNATADLATSTLQDTVEPRP